MSRRILYKTFHQTLCNQHCPDQTYPQASAPFDSKSEDREKIAEPLCTDGPAPTLEMPEEQERGTYTPGSQKSTRKDFGKPASSFSDFYM